MLKVTCKPTSNPKNVCNVNVINFKKEVFIEMIQADTFKFYALVIAGFQNLY